MKILIFILMLTATKCFAQQDTLHVSQDTLISYSGIINIDGVSKEELFIRARDWCSNNLRSLQIQDKEIGELSAKNTVTGTVTFRLLGAKKANAGFNFDINIWVKDGRLLYSVTNINNTAITYADKTTSARDDLESPIGLLYTSKHAKSKVFGLSQTKSDETYQSAKDAFDKIIKELIASLQSFMQKKSTPDF
ncbi:MAG TPA: DUF4468 domain-containing protein [Puia sp.]|jgi:hypothetical protein|nr:DUF4468 domain-containing protein [Puia sp.]